MATTTPIHFTGQRYCNAAPNAPTFTEEQLQAKADYLLQDILDNPTDYRSQTFYLIGAIYEAGYAFRSNDPIKILVNPHYGDWTMRFVLTNDPETISKTVAEFDPPDEEDGYPTQWIFFPSEDQVYEVH